MLLLSQVYRCQPEAYMTLAAYRIRDGQLASDDSFGNNGAFMLPVAGKTLQLVEKIQATRILGVIVSDGEGWDHVSVSLPNRCPTWDEMCFVKSLFFEPEEVAMQLHPAKSEYVNYHPSCLHLWRPQMKRIPTPPSVFVGPKKLQTIPCEPS